MGNVNFSADMIGILTLAQQGKSPVQDGELAMGSFEDMIMQMIASNMAVVPEQNTEMSFEEEEKAKTQNVISDAIFSGMINPEIQGQIVAEDTVSAENVISESVVFQNNPVNVVAPLQTKQNAEVIAVTADFAVQTDSNEEVVFADSVKTVVTEVVQNNADDVTEVARTPDITPDNSIEAEVVQVAEEATVVVTMPSAAKQSDEQELTRKYESFISTEDMLMMRAGNKIDFSEEQVVFKVAETPINMESATAVSELADKILMKFTEKEFEVELYPKNLGKITVSLAVEDGVVQVALSSTNDKVNEFLASQSATIQNIVEKNTQYQAVVKLDDSQGQYQQQQRDNAQHGAAEEQKNRQQEHLQNLYSHSVQHTTEDFLSMLRMV